jgi:hypothetical protein
MVVEVVPSDQKEMSEYEMKVPIGQLGVAGQLNTSAQFYVLN